MRYPVVHSAPGTVQTSDHKFATVNDAVRAFLREELHNRYANENIRRFRQLKGMDPETLEAFRDFALRRLYPEGEVRAEIDASFSELHEILLTPGKLASLGSVLLASAWSLGRRLPKAISACQQVIHTYFCASAVEDVLRDAILEEGWPWKLGLDRHDMQKVFAELPEQPFQDLIEALVHLLELSVNRETMKTGLDLLEKISNAMASDSGTWTDTDRRGLALARETLAEAVELSSRINDRDIPRFLRGIEAVERHWLLFLRTAK